MNRRSFLRAACTAGATSGAVSRVANAYIPEHNWEKFDWGSGPEVHDRLYQGPFPQYAPAPVVPDSDVVMVTTPSEEIIANYGMGLIVYVSGDTGPPRIPGETLEKSLEDLVKIPFTQKIYIPPTGAKCRQDLANWISQIGGRSLSTSPSVTTSASGSASCWKIRTIPSRACPTS